ncbi:MAG: hypothetical protein QOG03_2314 [Actinomycetota bacterium]|nr:hypothetical protein [Actinomycetota bacterium]
MAEDLTEVERELVRIPEVTAARIVTDDEGKPVEVHILASPEKHAKQVVRDVQSVAMASFGLDLDRRVISVVQLDSGNGNGTVATEAPGSPVTAEANGHTAAAVVAGDRITVERVIAVRDGLQCDVEVSLRRGGDTASGSAGGSMANSAVLRSVAQATLAALRVLEPAAARADLESAVIVTLGDRAVAVTSIVILVPPYEEIVSGSAVVRTAGDHDAMARAVLDATNRRLSQLV